MKKKQIKTYILLVIVLIIWGLLIYRIVKSINPDENATVNIPTTEEYKKPIQQDVKNEFALHIPYRDPFLDIVLKQKPRKQSQSNRTKPKFNTDSLWSNITYKGMIAKSNSQKHLYMVKLKNQDVFLSLNQKHNNFKLIKANNKSITLKYKIYTKSFKLNP